MVALLQLGLPVPLLLVAIRPLSAVAFPGLLSRGVRYARFRRIKAAPPRQREDWWRNINRDIERGALIKPGSLPIRKSPRESARTIGRDLVPGRISLTLRRG